MDYIIREMRPEEVDELKVFLYEAFYVPIGEELFQKISLIYHSTKYIIKISILSLMMCHW